MHTEPSELTSKQRAVCRTAVLEFRHPSLFGNAPEWRHLRNPSMRKPAEWRHGVYLYHVSGFPQSCGAGVPVAGCQKVAVCCWRWQQAASPAAWCGLPWRLLRYCCSPVAWQQRTIGLSSVSTGCSLHGQRLVSTQGFPVEPFKGVSTRGFHFLLSEVTTSHVPVVSFSNCQSKPVTNALFFEIKVVWNFRRFHPNSNTTLTCIRWSLQNFEITF